MGNSGKYKNAHPGREGWVGARSNAEGVMFAMNHEEYPNATPRRSMPDREDQFRPITCSIAYSHKYKK